MLYSVANIFRPNKIWPTKSIPKENQQSTISGKFISRVQTTESTFNIDEIPSSLPSTSKIHEFKYTSTNDKVSVISRNNILSTISIDDCGHPFPLLTSSSKMHEIQYTPNSKMVSVISKQKTPITIPTDDCAHPTSSGSLGNHEIKINSTVSVEENTHEEVQEVNENVAKITGHVNCEDFLKEIGDITGSSNCQDAHIRSESSKEFQKMLIKTLKMNLITLILFIYIVPKQIIILSYQSCYQTPDDCEKFNEHFTIVSLVQFCVSLIHPLIVLKLSNNLN